MSELSKEIKTRKLPFTLTFEPKWGDSGTWQADCGQGFKGSGDTPEEATIDLLFFKLTLAIQNGPDVFNVSRQILWLNRHKVNPEFLSIHIPDK
jgi:hypothetical protein